MVNLLVDGRTRVISVGQTTLKLDDLRKQSFINALKSTASIGRLGSWAVLLTWVRFS